MTALAAWIFSSVLCVQQTRLFAAQQERLQLARQRAAMQQALHAIRAAEACPFSIRDECDVEGLHSHQIHLLVDRGLGTKHECKVPKEWLER